MRPHEQALIQRLVNGLRRCESGLVELPGIQEQAKRHCYVSQLVDSIRRVRYVSAMAQRNIHKDRADSLSLMFDPLKAAVLHQRIGDVDEACWLVFLFIHFGKHATSGFRYAREVYGALGAENGWTWKNISINPNGFRAWLDAHEDELARGMSRGFGNHRKYQSLSAYRPNGTGDAVASYVQWVLNHGNHKEVVDMALEQAHADPAAAFDWLYHSMNCVISFGRTARFDYLTMLGKLGLAHIKPGSAYLAGATGPLAGARLMLQGNASAILNTRELDKRVAIMAKCLSVGMQEMEDSLCNWKKSPKQYIRFLG